MDILLPVLIIATVVALTLVVRALKPRDLNDDAWPFYAKKPLSAPEQVLYFRLCKALPDQIVLVQVALSRMLGVNKGHNFGQWFNRINRMSADFVICSKDSAIIAVIELDDASHKRTDREVTDAKKTLGCRW